MPESDPRIIDLAGEWLITPPWGEWKPIDIPTAWQSVLGDEFHGSATMKRTVRIDRHWIDAGRRRWLCFEAVATDCQAWVGGMPVGRHVGDWLPFMFEVTDALRQAGETPIELRVDEIPAPPPAKVGDLQNGHITKGFHDVISCHHGGVWQPVHLKCTGSLAIRPDGLRIESDCGSGETLLTIEMVDPAREAGRVDFEIRDATGRVAAMQVPIESGATSAAARLRIESHRLWSPANPHLYTVKAVVFDQCGESDRIEHRFGFRTVKTGGPNNRQILLNDEPIMLRGVLHWGHEPRTFAPAPTREQVREEFERLQAMGFNAVCLCMWYPPRWYFDLADATGMLIWQEHPVWQSPMRDADVEEYKRLFAGFFRRDRNHPSVVIVSATCEHPRFHPVLAEWWWNEARAQLPNTLLQLQTAFFKWADLARTDLHDEHTYDNSNRWVGYLEDVQHELAKLDPKPFAMGETIAFTSWPDVPGLAAANNKPPWWYPRAFKRMRELESQWRRRYGEATLARFRRQSERHHLLGRKFQVEQFRAYPNHAAIVMNHLSDVPVCQCGFRDDLGRWRFDAEDCRGWLGDVALLLRTPDHRRAFMGDGGSLACEVAIANFGDRDVDDSLQVAIDFDLAIHERASITMPVHTRRGEIARVPITLPLPSADQPARMRVEAEIEGMSGNAWDLLVFPRREMRWPSAVMRLDGLPFTPADREPDEVERGYSRGYGLAVRNWICELPDPAKLLPQIAAWRFDQAIPTEARVIVSHKLTHPLVDFMEHGGRVILFASKTAGGLGTSYEWLFGQAPLVIEEGPLGHGDSEWILDLLDYDLVRRYARVIPAEALGIADQVDPLIRLCYTHDQNAGRVKFFDQLFMTRVGKGLLIVSSLDHSEDAGQHVLAKMIDFALREDARAHAAIDPATLRGFAIA